MFMELNEECLLQVIEPSLGNGGETIAIIAIKLSVQSVFSRLRIDTYCSILYDMY